ncbi:cysteinyl-tRNA synthetase, unknown class [Flavobacterium segetis]|uniref:Glycoside-hydrolase family GH114 TIM-barrel domain-containing protein n=1 Tax=Flavobacterium segetis TaxID=271157 RepID=A0A1M5GLL0_9FLAO|nr:endo alpha-1,4 polygalactosaminidase [Flavobacterium segetis]SHG04609.1 cysteinyl-tRNA synthetase, unknown class [Flavobacterium segetis]
MKILYFTFLVLITFSSCSKNDESTENTVANSKQKMRDFVIGISRYSKAINPKFNIIPQNGIELVSIDGDNTQQKNNEYLNAIDAVGQEDLWYGYDDDNQATPAVTISYLKEFLNLARSSNKKILVTDYCSTSTKVDNSYLQNNNSGYVSFAANQRELNTIPNYPIKIYLENNAAATSMGQVKNFLYLINPTNYSSKNSFINAVVTTNYDLLIMDLFFTDGTPFTALEINQLKNKANGGKRLVVSYMSIGEAEDYRYYWESGWSKNKPVWLDAENPAWPGNFKVRYWSSDWQNIIYSNENSYLKKILNAGFDGVYLDIIDAFEYYD